MPVLHGWPFATPNPRCKVDHISEEKMEKFTREEKIYDTNFTYILIHTMKDHLGNNQRQYKD